MYRLPAVGANMPKYVGVVKGHTFSLFETVDSLGFINEDITKVKVMEKNKTNNH